MLKICIITGSRAEWGLLKPLAEKIHIDPDIILQLIVTGSHLSPQFGMTANKIPADWISDKVECILASDTPVAISKSIGLAVISFGEVYERLKPDLVIILGDRFEILASVIAAHISGIPIAHLHGGEVTEGAYDNAMRMAITHMSQLHFVAAELYRDRVIQLGEHPDTVFNVGALGCDGLDKRKDRNKSYKIIIAFYPSTLDKNSIEQFQNLYSVLDSLAIDLYFVKSNMDRISLQINGMINSAVHESFHQIRAYDLLKRNDFLELLLDSDAIVGNSSAGIIEAPALGVPTINIGDRQKGRLMADSIIQAEPTKESIQAAFDKLYSKEFQDLMKTDYCMPYKGENVAEKMLAIIREQLPNIKMKKGFYDLPRF